jgi:hypothetical protein
VRSASQASIARPQLDVVMLLAAMMIGIYFLTMYVAFRAFGHERPAR